MKIKILFVFLLTIILALAVVSAATFSIVYTNPSSFSKSKTETNFIITNRGPETVNIALTLPTTISDGKGHEITITSSSPFTFNNIAPNQNTGAINIAYSGDTTNFKIGEFSNSITAKAEQVGNASNNVTLIIPLKFLNTFCKLGENATADQALSISSIDIRNNDGDDTEWTPLDQITVKVKVENSGNSRISGVYAELGLFNSDGKNIVGKLDGLNNKKISLSTINEGNEKTAPEFTFKIPTDFKEDTYSLVIKTYKSGKENEICSSFSSDLDNRYYQTITGARESDTNKEVVVDNIVLSPEETAQCSDKVQVSADVVNIGIDDFNDQFKVTLYNKELGVDLNQVIQEDLNSGDSRNIDFSFDVPKNATEKSYNLEFRTYYDYNDNTYNEVSSNKFLKTIKISGNCQSSAKPTAVQLKITAELDTETPEAIAGKKVIIKATLINTGDLQSVYSVSIYGNSPWSNQVSIDPKILSLDKGESGDVNIVLELDQEAVGDKEFFIKATSGDKSIEQKVTLSITKPEVQFGKFSEHLKKNWFIYLIVIANLILIIAIILVIRRMVSSPRRDFE